MLPTSPITILFVLVNRAGKVLAVHTKTPGFGREAAQKYFQQSLQDRDVSSHWWFGEHHLYQTFIQPVYRGSRTDGTMLGFLVIGYEIDHRLARRGQQSSGQSRRYLLRQRTDLFDAPARPA